DCRGHGRVLLCE
nr:immunoglobulin heavy chain junction region [Homo sapiens]